MEAMVHDDINTQASIWKQMNPKGKLFQEGNKYKGMVKAAGESEKAVQSKFKGYRAKNTETKDQIANEHLDDLEARKKEAKPKAEGLDATKADEELAVEQEEDKLGKCQQETAKLKDQETRL